MPTLVWRYRPKGGHGAAGGDSAKKTAAVAAAVSDPVVSASAAVPDSQSAVYSVVSASTKQFGDDGKERKRKRTANPNPNKSAARKKEVGKATSERNLPTGVERRSSGKFRSLIDWDHKIRHIGTFDTPEQASAAFLSVRKDREDSKLSALSADEIDALFDAAQKKAVDAGGGIIQRKRRARADHPKCARKTVQAAVSKKHADDGKKKKRKVNHVKTATFLKKRSNAKSERDLPTGVSKTSSGKLQTKIKLGGTNHYIGTFDTPEQASAAYISVKKDLGDVQLSSLNSDEVNSLFDAAKKKALESFGGFIPETKDQLPRGVAKSKSGKFQSMIQWCDKKRYIGVFGTPEQASAAYISMKKDRDEAKASKLGVDEGESLFDAAKKKALETVQDMP